MKKLLEQETVLDNLLISLNGALSFEIPLIFKASILLADKLTDVNKRNMIIFPEQQSCAFVFMLLGTLFNISEGRIKKDYDPYSFITGEKLKFKNSVVEFVKVETDRNDNVERIFVKFVDGGSMRLGMPLETAPFLQRVRTKRLSKYQSFYKEYAPFLQELSLDSSRSFIQKLPDHKTHLDSSAVFVAPILNSKRLFIETSLNGERISDILLLAQADLDGRIKNMTSGQLEGIPAIVLFKDLYSVNEAIDAGLEINSVFVEANQLSIDNQLDALDNLLRRDKPVILLTDQVNYNDFSNLESRNFSIWTWNENTISSDLYSDHHSQINIRVKNAAQRKINFVDVVCQEISKAVTLLYKNKKLIEDKSASIIQVFQELFEIALFILRTISPLKNTIYINEVLRCKSILIQEKSYISEELFTELTEVADNIAAICTQGYDLPKVAAITSLLLSSDKRHLFVIIPLNAEKNDVEQCLKVFLREKDTEITVIDPKKYLLQAASDSLTIVSGWLNKATMNKILNSNITPEITVLLYENERRWKNGYIRNNLELSRRNDAFNMNILSLINRDLEAGLKEDRAISVISSQEPDELEEIEITLRQNKYRRYISSSAVNSVEAVPVSFVGDFLAFYKISRTLLTATKLINGDYENIEEVKPFAIQSGDFVIERETQRDLIRDIADIILKNSGCFDLRNVVYKWKEALEVESVFSDEETIYEKLQAVGCARSRATVHLWLTDNDMITPQSKDDIAFIAKATEDSVLLEIVDRVFDAGKIIKSVHIQAGHHLAEKLKTSLSTYLISMGNIDSFNTWEPIEVEIENIGNIKILKVIDVGTEVFVDEAITNKLIDTNKFTA